MFAVPRRLPHRTRNTIVLLAVMIGLVTGEELRDDDRSDAYHDVRCLCLSRDSPRLRVERRGHTTLVARCADAGFLC